MFTKETVELSYNWNEDRRTVGQIVMEMADNNKRKAKEILKSGIATDGIYEEALVKQCIIDIDTVPEPKVKVVKVKPDSDIAMLFKMLFGE